jgi:hypothetical protein
MDELETGKCELCGSLSAGSLTGMDVFLKSKDGSKINLKFQLKDDQKNPLGVCLRCGANILGSFAAQLMAQAESMEKQRKERDA